MARLEHVGIAVNDVAAALEVLADLLDEPRFQVEKLEEDGIRTHFVWGGSAKLELLEALDDQAAVGKFLRRRGPGLHHLAFEVDDVRAMHDRARKAGYEPLEREPRQGADGKLIFFLHPKQTAGVLIEFCQSMRPALRPMSVPDVDGLRSISEARGSSARAPCVYLFKNRSAVDPGELSTRLQPHRTLYAAEAASSLRVRELLTALDSDEPHLAADTELIPAALQAARDGGVRSLILIDPDVSAIDRLQDIHMDLLVLARADENGLRLASTVRSLRPTARLAIVSDPQLHAAIIASHLEEFRS